MDQATHNKIVSFIWGIADDVLRDLFKRGKYPDVILPMCVLRRLDAVLEPTKKAVLETKEMLDNARITAQRAALCEAAGEAFYNTSKFTLRDLRSRGSQQQLRQDFEDYLNGFSSNVQDILENFKFRNQITTLSKSDSLGTLIEKFLDPEINLSPNPVLNADGSVKHPAMDNHSMGTVFEELVRKFNEENNEEAGEHWAPRDAVKLMANLIFLPVADAIESGSYLLYDGALGTGGMLTVAEETLKTLAAKDGKQVITHLYGQEINPETYAICKADMLLKGEGENADHVVGGAEWSTLSHDAFPAREFDFMLSNPPYGKSWKKDLETMGGKEGMRDPRFRIQHADDPDYSLVTRSSDGQMLFLANMAAKMNHKTPLGSRIAEVHNGSSLFTGDAGQGESNIRRWLIENDWLEAIVALPLNLFYNTGIATYIWMLSNRKPEHRKERVQLIDATQWFKPLRKNLGKKNCELSVDDIRRICDTYLAFKETEQSKIFPNAAFGYWKVTVERPLRLHSQLTVKAIESLRFASGDKDLRGQIYDEFGDALSDDFASVEHALEQRLAEWGSADEEENTEEEISPKKSLPEKKKTKLLDARTWERDSRFVETATVLRQALGGDLFEDYNLFRDEVDAALDRLGIKLGAADLKVILNAVSWRVETAPPVIAKVHKPGKATPDALHGRYEAEVAGKKCVVEYEPDSDLRDTEQVPLLEQGSIEAFIRREVLPYTPDAWIKDDAKIGYEIEIVSTLSRQLAWSHFLEIIYLKTDLQRDFYAEMCRIEHWSVRMLRSRINSMLYERTALSKKPKKLIEQELKALREEDRLTPDLVFRDPYVLDFLGLKDTYSERDLEAAILRELESFLLELGAGFAFVERQKRITLDGEDFYMDLLFFHRRLRRLVVVELKLGDFKPADLGQIQLYLNWLDRHERQPGEEKPLGLILCAGKKTERAEYLDLDRDGVHLAEYLRAAAARTLAAAPARSCAPRARPTGTANGGSG